MPNPSKSANATEAPTSGATEANLQAKISGGGLSADQLDFVNLIEQHYGVTGHVMTLAEALREYFFEHNEFVSLLSNDLVRAALAEREVMVKPSAWSNLVLVEPSVLVDPETTIVKSDGVGHEDNDDSVDRTGVGASDYCSHCGAPTADRSSSNGNPSDGPNNHAGEWREKALTPLQLIAVNMMLDLIDQRSEKKKLQDIGVSTAQWQMWLKDPTFAKYLHQRAEAMLGDHQHEAQLALLDKIRMGDINAIKYYNEMTGKYKPETASSPSTNMVTDFKQLLIRILEVINDEVNDPTVAFKIAERFKSLISMQFMANQLTDQAIVQPEVAPARELSPRLIDLMEHGAGS